MRVYDDDDDSGEEKLPETTGRRTLRGTRLKKEVELFCVTPDSAIINNYSIEV